MRFPAAHRHAVRLDHPVTTEPDASPPAEAPFAGMQEVTDATFRAAVLESELPVLVDLWAPWCAPCRLVEPVVEALGRDLVGRLTMVKLDIDENVAVATEHQVFSIPTLVLFKEGREVERVIGFKRKGDLAARSARHF